MMRSIEAIKGGFPGHVQQVVRVLVPTSARTSVSFDVAPDGQRFVMVLSDEAARMGQLTVVQNWLDELKSRAPAQ